MSASLPPKAQVQDTPLLPKGEAVERPLMVIMTTMAFLASLTLMLTLMGFRTSNAWQADLNQTATVQIYLTDSQTAPKVIADARSIVASNFPGTVINPVSESDAQALLQPWLGNIELPEGLAMPIMLRLTDVPVSNFEPQALKALFSDAGIEVDVDDHSRWGESLLRTWQAVQFGMMIIIVIVLTASMAVATFAAQSVLRARRNIIYVLKQVGAPDKFIVRLFWTRFLGFGLKGAFVGALIALLFLFLFSILKGSLPSGFLPALSLQVSDFIWLGILTVVMGIITALTAGLAAKSDLKRSERTV